MNTVPGYNWYAFDKGKSIGKCGSENGVIIRDEENSAGARITLERIEKQGNSFIAITVGIYGWMVHTCYLGRELGAQEVFDTMKLDIVKILDIVLEWTDGDDERYHLAVEAFRNFVNKYPI